MFREKERDSMRNKRQDPEFKEKESDSIRNKRQDPGFKGKERESKRRKRQNPEFKGKERDCMMFCNDTTAWFTNMVYVVFCCRYSLE